MEFIIVGVIIIVAVCMLYFNIKNQVNGDCGSGCKGCKGCKGCSYSCEVKSSNKKKNKIQ